MIIRTPQTLITANWDGGTTTELFIFPETASYVLRNFAFRISTATVETEVSQFTSLPGYLRKLMVLEGELRMCHEYPDGILEVMLSPFEQDAFSGDWKTTGYGKVRDFNVMHDARYHSKINFCIANSGDSPQIVSGNSEYTILYVFNGSCVTDCKEIATGTVLVLSPNEEVLFAETHSLCWIEARVSLCGKPHF